MNIRTEILVHADRPTFETEQTRAIHTALTFLRHSGIQSYVVNKLGNPIATAETMIQEFAITASYWNLEHTLIPDLDANTQYAFTAQQVHRNMNIRRTWWLEGDKKTRQEADQQFLHFINITMRPFDPSRPDMLAKPNKTYHVLFNELWYLLASNDMTNRVNAIVAKTGDAFEDVWLKVANSSLVFCLMVDQRQKETHGAFIAKQLPQLT